MVQKYQMSCKLLHCLTFIKLRLRILLTKAKKMAMYGVGPYFVVLTLTS